MDMISGVKALISLSKGIAAGTLTGMASGAIAVTMAVKKTIDAENQRLLHQTEQNEGCAHIELIDGWSQPFNDMLAHLTIHGGISWQNGDGNGLWYYHAQDTFRPLVYLRAYHSKRIASVSPSEAGKIGCQKCEFVQNARRKSSGQ